MVPKMMF